MLDVCGSYGNTGESNIFLPLRETVDFAVAAGWPRMFTTFMAGADGLEIGESITTSLDAFVENATHMDTERNRG